MSFSSSVKTELMNFESLSACCNFAQAYGLVLFARFSTFDISITTENPDVAKFYSESLSNVCGVDTVFENGTEGVKITPAVNSPGDIKKVYDIFGHSAKDITLRINRANLQDDCCAGAFIRGVFLACGTVTDPNKNYHLEFIVSYKKLCNDLVTLLSESGFNPKYVQRKGYHVVYFKESESIEDLLTFMGATESSLELMGVKMEKDIKNRVNRRINFEMSNLNKTIDAGSRQAEACRIIEEKCGIDSLPDNLQETARLRLENPEASLTELASMLSVPVTRSGLNHRLAKIMDEAKKIKESE